MTLPAPSRTSGPLTWRRTGLWVVVFATALALLGMVIALRQIQAGEQILQRHAHNRAIQIANEARSAINQHLAQALQTAAFQATALDAGKWHKPAGWPGWIDGLYTWDGKDFRSLSRPSGTPEEIVAEVRRLVEGQRVEDATPRWAAVEILYGKVGQHDVVVGYGRFHRPQGGWQVLAGTIHLERLRKELVEPMLLPGDGLELVRQADVDSPWSQPMFGPARFWVLQPTRTMLDEQQRTMTWQAVISVALTMLALATLLGAIAYLVRLARREVTLAEVKANFVADVSHELKTPLATIKLFAETLQSGRVTSEEKRHEYYAIITRETTRLTTLIENILDFARIDAGKKLYAIRPTDIRQAIRDAVDAYRDQLDHHGFEHEVRMADDLPPVSADPDAIAQVLLNLMSNAVKYSGDEKYLLIEVTRDTRRGAQGALISVHDRGIGIAPDERRHLFEGFYRANDDRVRAKGGTGLGLALVKQIVDAHGGHIHVESRLVKGTTFRVFLPAAEVDELGVSSSARPAAVPGAAPPHDA